MTDNRMVFQPTKSWFKEHSSKPSECMVPTCTCIIDSFNNNHQGFCVGLYPHNGDHDMISLCFVAWNNKEERLERQNAVLHPSEAAWLATFLSMASAEAWSWLPDYRSDIGKLMRKRTRDIKRSKANSHMIVDPIALRREKHE